MTKKIPPHREAPAPDKPGMFCALCGALSVCHRLYPWIVEWVALGSKGGTDQATVLICGNCEGERHSLQYRHENPEDEGESQPLTKDEIDAIAVANAALASLQSNPSFADRSAPSFFQLMTKKRNRR